MKGPWGPKILLTVSRVEATRTRCDGRVGERRREKEGGVEREEGTKRFPTDLSECFGWRATSRHRRVPCMKLSEEIALQRKRPSG